MCTGAAMIARVDASLYTIAFLTVGTLHVFYDGVIWKLRTPDVADGFDLADDGNEPLAVGPV